MKTRLISSLLLLLLIGSCRKDTDIGPADLLYKRWRADQRKAVGSDKWVPFDPDALYDTEYRADGLLIHRRSGIIMPAPCCSGGRYERDGAIIKYGDLTSCPLVSCASTGISVIITLNERVLELRDGNTIVQFIPVL